MTFVLLTEQSAGGDRNSHKGKNGKTYYSTFHTVKIRNKRAKVNLLLVTLENRIFDH